MADTTSTTQFKADISQLKSAMQAAQRQVRLASSEFQKASAGLDDWSSSAEGLQAKVKQLNSTLEAQKKQVELANEEWEKTVKVYGENSAEADRAKMKLNGYEAAVAKTEKQLNQYQSELKDCEEGTGRFADETADLEDATQRASDGFTVMKGALANLVADGIRLAIDATKELAKQTLEAGMNFESGMAQVQAVSGATGEEMDQLAEKAKEMGVKILPVDSEHSAIFQSLSGYENKDINKIILTASGGPFRGKTIDDLKDVTVKDALKHPKWNMGQKISIDSATLMNKGLEVIEAHFLFDTDYDNIEVVVHPQSIIHSMVEYKDASIISQMGSPDMRLPIQYALNYPERKERIANPISFYEISTLTFEKPDMETFKCLKLAYEAGKIGGLAPAILNGANEEAVALLLEEKIKFLQIGDIIEECMDKFKDEYKTEITLHNIIDLDKRVREYIRNKWC